MRPNGTGIVRESWLYKAKRDAWGCPGAKLVEIEYLFRWILVVGFKG